MRRADREIKNRKDILDVIRKCDVCRLALNDDEYPYIVPLNFGMRISDDNVYLYFHGAAEGTKYDLMEKDSRASFEMDCEHRLVSEEDRGYCTMEYESVTGRGILEPVPDGEREEALKIITAQYHENEFVFSREAVMRTRVFRLRVISMTGKRKRKPGRV